MRVHEGGRVEEDGFRAAAKGSDRGAFSREVRDLLRGHEEPLSCKKKDLNP
jgi:hypothetical protein